MSDLRNSVDNKEIAGNKNPNKLIEAKLLGFNEQQKSRGLKILTLKQMLQLIPVRKNIWKLTKRDHTNHIFFLSSKRNYQKKYNN